jgi:hypothetical protein
LRPAPIRQLRYSSSLPPVLAPLLGAALFKRAKLGKGSRNKRYIFSCEQWSEN